VIPPLLPEAFSVTRGSHLPRRSAADYRAAAATWAETWARPDESPTVALARAVTSGSEVVDIFYRAAAIACALDALSIDELVPPDAPDAHNRRAAWASLLDLCEPHRRDGEQLRDTLRRLLGSSLAVRCCFLLILQEPKQ
jgi:hypothetical protein